MFAEMAESQGAVVAALLDEIARDDWRFAWVHAEFEDPEARMAGLREGFVVLRGGERAWLELNPPVGTALEAMHQAHARAGQGFARLELLVEKDESYRFELGHRALDFDPALADRRYGELVQRA